MPVSVVDLEQIPPLAEAPASFIAAKISASDIQTSRCLLAHGFRRICTQVALSHGLSNLVGPASSVAIEDTLQLVDRDIAMHAQHFKTSRFHQDPLINAEIADSLYAKWISNSLCGGKRVAHAGPNFCTFSDRETVRSIDLLSVLDKQRGFARAILQQLLIDAKGSGCSNVEVLTEAENAPALAAYRSVNFSIVDFISVFHRYKPS